jgi:Family of unknown function (DUF5681)
MSNANLTTDEDRGDQDGREAQRGSKMSDQPDPTGRKQARGRFQPGRSGNPKGRPAGTRNTATVAAQALLDGEAEALTRKAIERALAGDSTALRLCLERLVAPRKGRLVTLDLPELRYTGDLVASMATVIKAMAEGRLSPDEAQAAGSVLELHRRAVETDKLERRVAALESRVSNDSTEQN